MNNNKYKKDKEDYVTQQEYECVKTIDVYKNKNLKDSAFRILSNQDEINKYVRLHLYINPKIDNKKSIYQQDKLDSEIYRNMGYDSIENTIKYIFDKMKTGVFIRIFNNQLVNFIPLYNLNFRNDYSEFIKFKEGNAANYYNQKRKDFKYVERINFDINKWNATNCLLRNEMSDTDMSIGYLHEFYDMLLNTCRHRKVGDCIFFLNRKDFPYIKKNHTESYNHIFGSDNYKLKPPYDKYNYVPIISQSTTELHADLTIPTADDWDLITQKMFWKNVEECHNPYIFPPDFSIPKWEDRKNIVIWRGQGTGCGSTIEDNPRLKLTKISQDLMKDNKTFLDAGIIKYTKRDKKTEDSKYVSYEKNINDIKFAYYIDKFEQLKYKYTINVEGNSAAYRFGSLFGLGFCILNVESKYTVWFEKFIQPYVHYVPVKHDLSDLVSQINWCLQNDSKCKEISENAKKMYDTYFTKDFVFDYISDMLNGISRSYTNYKEIYDTNLIKSIYKRNMETLNTNNIFIKFINNTKRNNDHTSLIIVPYRDNKEQNRAEQLKKFIEHYKNYDVLIVEQSNDNRKFNRGALLNCGVNYARKEFKTYRSFIMHDVDILMNYDIIDKYFLGSLDGIVHLGTLTPKYMNMYPNFLGAILKIDDINYFKVNGFPNNFWGWGSEDDALFVRIVKNNLKIKIPDIKGVFGKELDHVDTRTLKNLVQENRHNNMIMDFEFWQMNGIKQSTFNLENTKVVSDYIRKITVEIL